jgi:probable rRNA maturation factor
MMDAKWKCIFGSILNLSVVAVSVNFFTEGGVVHPFSEQEEQYVQWLATVAASEETNISGLNYIFCSDEYLLDINIRYLGHDDYTDIITFPYHETDNLEGDLFISLDRVRENAMEYECSFEEELRRVMAHGLLHLRGYKDKNQEDSLKMRNAENRAIASFKQT